MPRDERGRWVRLPRTPANSILASERPSVRVVFSSWLADLSAPKYLFDSQFDSHAETQPKNPVDVSGMEWGDSGMGWTFMDTHKHGSRGLKIRYLCGCVGSSPSPGTNFLGTKRPRPLG